MERTHTTQAKDKSAKLTFIGLLVMILLSLTQLLPSLRLAGFAVFVGVAFFFIVEAVAKTPKDRSGLRCRGLSADFRKPGVLLWSLLPLVTAIIPFLMGEYVLHNGFSAHVLARTAPMLSFDKLPLLILQVVVLAFGEEIAWRGFFLGKSMQRFPFWLCAAVSSLLFAMGHISDGNIGLVLYDLCFVFIDSLIFCVIYRKSGNCVVSTISHILGNAVGLLVCFVLL